MLQWMRKADSFGGTLSSQWTRRNGGTNPLTSSGMLTTDTTAGFYPAEFVPRATRGPDQYSAWTIAQLHPGTAGGSPCGLILRCPNNATSGTVPVLLVRNTQLAIYTMTSWAGASFTERVAYTNANGGSNMAVGGRVEFYVTGNIYTGTYNGTPIVTWNDSGAIASQTGRYGGVFMQYGTDGTVNGVMGFDDFVFGDYRPVDVPMPMQAINRLNY